MAITSVIKLLNDPRYERSLSEIIDQTNRFLIDPDKESYQERTGQRVNKDLLAQFSFFDKHAPIRQTEDFDFLQYQFRRNMSIGSVIPTGGEIPATTMGQLIKFEGGMIKLALSHIYDEQTRINIIKMRKANNIPKDFVKWLYGTVNDLQFKLTKLVNVLTAQILYSGGIRYTDPRTNTLVELTYPDLYPQLFPAPNTDGASWDNYATANGLQDLIDLNYAFYKVNGFYPEANYMSTDLMEHLLRQDSTYQYALSAGLVSANPASTLPKRVTEKVFTDIVKDNKKLVPIMEWDAQYELEIAPGQTVRARYLPTTHVITCCDRMGERLFGPTVESAEDNINGDPKAGIYLKSDENLRSSPPQSRSFGVARIMPFFPDTRKLCARQMLAA